MTSPPPIANGAAVFDWPSHFLMQTQPLEVAHVALHNSSSQIKTRASSIVIRAFLKKNKSTPSYDVMAQHVAERMM